MPGKRITGHQVHQYKQHRNKLSQVASAAKAGISERSARRIEDAQSLPSQRPEWNWRTREDQLSAVWDSEVIPLLQTDARLNAVMDVVQPCLLVTHTHDFVDPIQIGCKRFSQVSCDAHIEALTAFH